MSESKKQKQKKQMFYFGVAIFALGIILGLMNYPIPSPVPTPTYISGGTTYFFPFLNWLTIIGIVVAVLATTVSRKSKQNE